MKMFNKDIQVNQHVVIFMDGIYVLSSTLFLDELF